MKSIHIQEFCKERGYQRIAADLLHVHQTAVSKMIRTGRNIFLVFDEKDKFIKAVERQERVVSKKSRARLQSVK